MAGKQEAELVSFKTRETMTSEDERDVAVSENRRWHISRDTTNMAPFFYRYIHPLTG
ncbi:hypothetical protein [Citrobacter sp. NCU1]|uniref:hypothetical protein n=1 Tax=Citrobacter sp. NCU1 TaxID=2026683 RepID=UPI001390FE7B|nr:hypothetical protein [Citrobacter sp. NCU1]